MDLVNEPNQAFFNTTMDSTPPVIPAVDPKNPVSQYIVTCANFGAHDLCNECGARTPHLNTSCEPCPMDKVDHCAPALAQNVPGEAIQKEGWANDSTDHPIEKNAFYHVFPAKCKEDETKVFVFKSALEPPKGETIRLVQKKPNGKMRNVPCACGSGKKFKQCCGRNMN